MSFLAGLPEPWRATVIFGAWLTYCAFSQERAAYARWCRVKAARVHPIARCRGYGCSDPATSHNAAPWMHATTRTIRPGDHRGAETPRPPCGGPTGWWSPRPMPGRYPRRIACRPVAATSGHADRCGTRRLRRRVVRPLICTTSATVLLRSCAPRGDCSTPNNALTPVVHALDRHLTHLCDPYEGSDSSVRQVLRGGVLHVADRICTDSAHVWLQLVCSVYADRLDIDLTSFTRAMARWFACPVCRRSSVGRLSVCGWIEEIRPSGLRSGHRP